MILSVSRRQLGGRRSKNTAPQESQNQTYSPDKWDGSVDGCSLAFMH
jgi:hypothetical protein